MDGHTVSLARGSIETRLVGDLSSVRLRDELLDMLAEPRVEAALARCSELGVDRALHPRLDAGPETVALVGRAREEARRPPYAGIVREELVMLGCLCRRMSSDQVYEWLQKLRMRRMEQDVVAAAVAVAPLLVERLSAEAELAPSQLHELLEGQPVEVLLTAVLLAPAGSPAATRVREYLQRMRDVRLEISGDDLRSAGVPESPHIGVALRQTLALKLDGVVSGTEQELAAALRLLAERGEDD
jgi:tRNA nucleotidyltransferase (CCA-adding enzyme)